MWEKRHGSNGFPVDTALFALFLQHVGKTTRSYSAVGTAVDAVFGSAVDAVIWL